MGLAVGVTMEDIGKEGREAVVGKVELDPGSGALKWGNSGGPPGNTIGPVRGKELEK